MSDQENQQPNAGTGENETPATPPNEKQILMQRAKLMGITFSNNISVEALREKINAKIAGETPPADEPEAPSQDGDTTTDLNPLAGDEAGKKPARKKSQREELTEQCMKLIRCRIQNLDPRKKDLPGEIFTIGNEIIGTVRKYVPYGEVTDGGYHLPWIIYQELDNRRFLNIRSIKDRRTGELRVETSWSKEFALEVLPQLTEDELKRLANAQAAAGSIDQGGLS
jgi:hypothetical protein